MTKEFKNTDETLETDVAQSAEETVRKALHLWSHDGSRRTLTWKEPEEVRKRVIDAPSQPLQILRALASLVAVSGQSLENGFSVPQIVTCGLALFPESALFAEVDGSIVIPTTYRVRMLLTRQGRYSLQSRGSVVCWEDENRVRRSKAMLRVHLTRRGAEEALEGGWLPPLAGYLLTLIGRAQKQVRFGKIELR